MTIYSINGQIVPEKEARISVEDLAVIRGFGVFDYLRTYNRIPFRMNWHIDRFFNSAEMIGLKISYTKEQVGRFVMEAMQESPESECSIRIVNTGGISPNGITPTGNGDLIIIVKATSVIPPEWYTKGASVISYKVERFMTGAKTINYLMAILAQEEAHAANAIEAVYISRDSGLVLEGTTSSVVFIKHGRLIIPPARYILDGISLKSLLLVAEKEFEIERRDIYQDELQDMDEIIICSSNREVVPITKFDEMIVGDGNPGPISKRLMELFRKETIENPEGL